MGQVRDGITLLLTTSGESILPLGVSRVALSIIFTTKVFRCARSSVTH